ncbi:MAG TPA: ABC transporter substrate-binding protein [Candidatus Limnocylindrales bacterium]|nr:ABC transporter substrate-binding protein [Candidatus Limnocylindrales bacterium]
MPLRRSIPVIGLVALLALAGCGTGSTTPAPSAPGSTSLTVGLGYIPSVQFAPFYLAQQKGYYRDAGLTVTFQNKIDPDLVTLVGQGTLDVGLADGTSVIPAVSQGIPIRYVATVYRQFPSIVFAKQTSGIAKAADLKGRKIGIPGRYGSSWIMLQALLGSANLKPEDVTITEYPDFGQGAAVQQGAVDAATGFVNNEPVQLEVSGVKTSVLRVDDVVPLPGPGLIAGTKTLETKRAAIAAFVAATLRAMREIASDPEAGLKATTAAVPDLSGSPDLQAGVLNATVSAWKGDGDAASFGAIDQGAWTKSIEYMTKLGLVPNPVKVDALVDASLLPRS